MRFVLSQRFADGLDEDGVVRRDADAVGLEEVAFDFQVEGRRQRAKEVVRGRPKVGVWRSEIQQSHV